jgi:hypothetical protein
MYSLTQIYEKIPAIDAAKILEGTTYLGITGTIGIKDSVTGDNGQLAITLPDGYYAGKTCTAGDSDLISGNIKSGINLFGVDGASSVVDTSTGDAVAADILLGKIAWVNGSEITGSAAAGDNVNGTNGQLVITIPDGMYSGSKTATAGDTDLLAANIKSGEAIFGVTGTYSAAGYTWSKFGSGSWEGVNENLDWTAQVGGTDWWAGQTYSYCVDGDCLADGTLKDAANYIGPPGGWNGSDDYTNFNNTALHNYAVIAADNTDLGDCTANKGDLVFPDGSVWDKFNVDAKPYSVKLAGCDSNDSNATTTWASGGGSDAEYRWARKAPSAVSIADAWDGIKDMRSGAKGTNTFSNNYTNDDYYTLPDESWYVNGGNSRLPMIDEYERARKSVPGADAGLLSGTSNLSSYNWSAERYPSSSNNARYFNPYIGSAYGSSVVIRAIRCGWSPPASE